MTGILLPEENRTLSPYTGWTRAHWLTVADTILEGAARHASPKQSLIRYPGEPGGYGAEASALEGFCRTFMLAAFRIAGDPAGTQALADRCARGIAAGVDPHGDERWIRPSEINQAKVEAAALAVGLHLTRDTVWVRLDDDAKAHAIDYLAEFIGAERPANNWAWFRIMVEQFLESVGGPFSEADREEDFALLDSLELDSGWTADGAGRNFDHYCGWALPFYPVFWADIVAKGDPRHEARVARYRSRLDDYLDETLHLVGADGAPLFQGRSLTYRFASAGAAWAAAYSGSSRHEPGVLRRAASGQVRHFVEHGAPDADGILSLGWHHAWQPMVQHYSSQGSPYWASKGMLGLALPEHPVWTAAEAALPIDRGDFTRILAAPGWLASGTADDGIVRIVNHGTDHRFEGDLEPDAPLYAKLGYSTATAPVLTGPGLTDPVDGTAALVRDGRPGHRSGFSRGALREDGGTLIGASSAPAHWPLELDGRPDKGVWQNATRTEIGPVIDIVSAVRGAWEVRFVRVRGEEVPGDELRIGGWALSADDVTGERTDAAGAWASAGARASAVVPLHGFDAASAGVLIEDDVTPLAARTATPWISGAVADGEWVAAGVLLGAASASPSLDASADGAWRITWPDGVATVVRPAEEVPDAIPS